tara:strand:- start:207 stop:1109 length:903 start_codon:yes stop_codon:yes gene_type:complete
MSFDVTALSAIKQEYDSTLMTPFILDNHFLNPKNNFCRIQPDIKGTMSVNILNSSITVALGHCGFTPSGTDTLSQVDITVVEKSVSKEFCIPELNTYWASNFISTGSYENSLGGSVEGQFFEENAAQISKAVENQAVSDMLTYINTNSGSSNVLIASAMTIGNASVVVDSFLDEMITSAPELTELEDVYMFMSISNFHALKRSYANLNNYHIEPVNGVVNTLQINGSNVTAVGLAGITTNEMVLTSGANILFGCDLMGEETQMDIWYSKDDRIVKMYSAFKQGLSIVFPQFCVYGQVPSA